MVSHCIYITYFSYRPEQLQKKKKKIPYTQSISPKYSEHFEHAFLWKAYQLCFRATGGEAWRDKGHWRSGERDVLPSRARLCKM